MPLTDLELRKAKPAAKPYKMPDGRGLYLLVTPAVGRYWRFRWERDGKERTVALGDYPAMGLSAARDAREAARSTLRAGRVPGAPANPEATFAAVAGRWHAQNVPHWAPRHAVDVLASLKRDLFPQIGTLNVRDIDVPTMLAALRQVETRGSIETARRIGQRAGMVFVFAIGEGLAVSNPADTARTALKHPVRGRQPAITDLDKLRAMMTAAEGEKAHPATKLALRLLALTAVRPGCITGAAWGEFEGLGGDAPVWRIPPERMKGKTGSRDEHVVPLAPAAVEAIEAARKLAGNFPFAFPNVRDPRKPMSENAIGYLLHRAGYHGHHVPHGFRASFSTIMNERFPADRAVIDLMLAHTPKDKIEAAYNRSERMTRRRELAAEWSGLLMEGAPPAETLIHGLRR